MTFLEQLDRLEQLIIDRAPIGDVRAQIATIREHHEASEAGHQQLVSEQQDLIAENAELVTQNLGVEAQLAQLKREAHVVVVTYTDGEIKEYPGDVAVLDSKREWYEVRKIRAEDNTYTVLRTIRASEVRDIKNPMS